MSSLEHTEPALVEPELKRLDGTVREAYVPALAAPVTYGSLADIPFDNASHEPDSVVLSRKRSAAATEKDADHGAHKDADRGDGGWQDVTAAEFAAEVLALAKGLIAEGLMPGDRIAIMARTTYEWTLLDFAAWAAGLVTVPVYPTSSVFQTRWILQDSGAVALAVETAGQAAALGPELDRIPDLRHMWVFEKGHLDRLAELGRDVSDQEVAVRRGVLGPDTLATLIYTSGTTGRPKGCALTHGNFCAEVDNAIDLLYPIFRAKTDEEASTLLFLPLAHVFGRMVAIGCMRARVRLGHSPSFRTEDLLADLKSFRPTFLLVIPYVMEKVFNTARASAERMGRASSYDRASAVARRYGEALEAEQHGTGPGPSALLKAARTFYDPLVYRRIRKALGGKVRYVICGGSPLGRRLAAFYAGAGIDVFEGYGMTETTAAVTVTPPNRPRLGTVGRPLPGTRVHIAADGEILLHGGQIFRGYWDPQAAWSRPGGPRRLVRDRRHRPPRRRGLPHDHRPQEGDPGHRQRQERGPGPAGELAPLPPPDRPRHGHRRPPPLRHRPADPGPRGHHALGPDERQAGHPLEHLATDPDLRSVLQRAVDEANRLVSRPESIRRFTVVPGGFTEEEGHLTPSMKLRREVVERSFTTEIEGLYEK